MVEIPFAKRARRAFIAAVSLAGLLSGCTLLETPVRPTSEVASPSTSPATAAPARSVEESPVVGNFNFEVVEGIDSVSNFRDVAGSRNVLELPDGAQMRRGVVYRSGKLKPISEEDKEALERVGLSDIFDLRTDEVSERTPDPQIGEAEHHLVNLFAVPSRKSWKYSDADDARSEREAMNRAFVSDPAQRAKTAEVLEGIAWAPGPVIIHCTEGKDRTGWISALLQLIAGADEEQVLHEYMLSNDYRKDMVKKKVRKTLKEKGKTKAAIEKVRAEVEPEFLQAGLDEMANEFGDLDNFLTKGVGLDQAVIDELRAKLRNG